MNSAKVFVLLFVGLIFQSYSQAFTPYENYLLSDEPRSVGLIALAEPEDLGTLKQLAKTITRITRSRLKAKGIENLNLFIRQIDEQVFVFAYYEFDSRDTDALTTVLGRACPEFLDLEKHLNAHPRAKKGEKWLNMEWMNCIATDEAFPHDRKQIMKMGLMSGLKPEHELKYRTLHQTNWPGVVDGMAKCNYRNWTTFIIDLGDELYLFTYTEYIGDYLEADNAMMAADPITNRWWKHTEPCLIDLAGEGNWTAMK